MIYDCMQVFLSEIEKIKQKNAGNSSATDSENEVKMLIDRYVPKDGKYIVINIDKDFAYEYEVDIFYDKKTSEIAGKTDSHYNYIRYLDYNSKLVEMNKPMDSKKVIHSNNMYSFFVKKDSIADGKLNLDIIDCYYDVLAAPERKYTKPKAKELYLYAENEIGKVDAEILEKIRDWVKRWFKDKSILPVELKGKDYFKLFFVYNDELCTKEAYEREGRRYLIPNIYNNNDYNLKIGDKVMGVPSNNMGLNSKKPFLENKTRKNPVPSVIDMEQAVLQSRFFDYLWGCASVGNVNIYIDFDNDKIYSVSDDDIGNISSIKSGMYLRIRKGKEVEILSYDMVLDMNSNLEPTFYYKNMLKANENSLAYGECNTIGKMALIVDEVLFEKNLRYNYFTEASDISITDGILKNILLTYREKLFEWFFRNSNVDIFPLLERMSLRLISNSVNNNHMLRAKHQMNLLWSLTDYFNRNTKMEDMITMVQKEFKRHIDMCHEEWDFVNDSEYYYAVGQVVEYFFSLSKAAKKPMSMANPFLNAKDDKLIKEKIGQMFVKYNHAMDWIKDVRAKNIISHIMLYECKAAVDTQYLIAGMMSDNLFWMKKDNKEGGEV